VFKAFFARPKDALDIATMVGAGSVDLARLRITVDALLDDDQERAAFFTQVGAMVDSLRSG
jgi:hypothetical protein